MRNIIIYANVTYNGAGVSGATVTFTDTNGNMFLPSTITTNNSGAGIVTYYIQNSNQATDTITGEGISYYFSVDENTLFILNLHGKS